MPILILILVDTSVKLILNWKRILKSFLWPHYPERAQSFFLNDLFLFYVH